MDAVQTSAKFGVLAATLVLALSAQAQTDISTVPLNTYSAPSSTDVKPNVLFILDDSGSMAFDFMPDWACMSHSTAMPGCNFAGTFPSSPDHEYLFRNPAYNGVYYDPAVTYVPPVTAESSGAISSTTYPSMTGVSTATGGDSSARTSARNWRSVKVDAYGVQSTAGVNLQANTTYPPYFFTTIPGEYCREPSLRNCTTASQPIDTGNPNTSYLYPAPVRWCKNSTLSDCQGAFSSTYRWVRSPSPYVTTITVSGSSTTEVSGIRVDGKQIMADTTSASSSSSTVAQRVVEQINACTAGRTGNCEIYGYRASNVNSVITLIAPAPINVTPAVTLSRGSMSFSTSAFSSGNIPGSMLVTVITPTVNSYPYPGSSRKHPSRTDCTGNTCTHAEEMTNFANWFTYYRTRMQLMKTSASNAFAKLDSEEDRASGVSRFRLGYMSINNSTSADFLNLNEFRTSHKHEWFTKLAQARPNGGTPLREALAKAGRLYGGKLNGATLNGSRVVDPLQYSCQQNFSILSSDGFWNGNAGYQLDGRTAVGNQDGWMGRPYADGASVQYQERTSQLRSQVINLQEQASTSTLQETVTQLQRRENQLMQRTQQLQARTRNSSRDSWGSWQNVTSCQYKTSGSPLRQCQYAGNWSAWTPVSSCTPNYDTSTSNNANWSTRVECQYAPTTAWTGTASCSPSTSGGTSTECRTETLQVNNAVAACTPTGIGPTGVRTNCGYSAWSAYSDVEACTPVEQSSSSPYAPVARQCRTLSSLGPWINASSCTESSTRNCAYQSWTSWSNVASCTADPQSTGPEYTVGVARECQTLTSGGTSNTLADVAAYYYNTDLRTPRTDDGTGTCSGPVIPPATTPSDLCDNNVPSDGGRDVASWQHMTTFTLGLGAQGQMLYAPMDGKDYWNDTSGDFHSVRTGVTPDHSRGICLWQANGQCTWPTPAADSVANIDDLWHAAVNGRGNYFSAGSPETLANGLNSTLETIVNIPRPGTAAAAASSNPNVTANDNFVFSSSYRSVDWYGELVRQRLGTDGRLSADNWSARKLLDCAVTPWERNTNYEEGSVYKQDGRCYVVTDTYVSGESFDGSPSGVDGGKTVILHNDETAPADRKVQATPLAARTIYTKSTSAQNPTLIPFDWTNLRADGLDAYFTKPHIAPTDGTGLSQFCASGANCLSPGAQDGVTVADGGAAGEALVNFLRGQRTHEGSYFRERRHVLGDIVSSEARYVQAPLFNYADANYQAFKRSKATRRSAVYVGANDGMLHAFDGENGQELWAYVPSMVLPNMFRLADKNYSAQHLFFVDGTPETGDICPKAPGAACAAGEWRTILVGGLNRGGKGFFALDITDPLSPRLLWEFTHTNLGYSYSNPRITKLKNGTWVVLLASGYNNAGGKGHLFVLNAHSGQLIRTISTTEGSDASPSGIARISAHAPNAITDNTSLAAYGGDLFGNLWRFDINGDIGVSGYDAHRLVTVLDDAGSPQPITVKPLEATVRGKPIVYVGTGRYLGVGDIGSTQRQTFYAIKDTLGTASHANPRASNSNFVRQVLSSGLCPAGTPSTVCEPGQLVRTATNNEVDWDNRNGWFIDFISTGERSVTDPSLGLGTLLFTTITPSGSNANACGEPDDTSSSFLYSLDYLTGGALPGTNGVVAIGLGTGLVTRPVMVRQADGTVRALIRRSSATATGTVVVQPPIAPRGSGGAKRVSWRPLTTQ